MRTSSTLFARIPEIDAKRTAKGWILFLPLCPSTNDRMMPVRFGTKVRAMLTKPARAYVDTFGQALWLWRRSVGLEPISNFRIFELWFVLPQVRCDAHNYGKVLFDAFERAELVTNDRFILPHIRGVWHSTKERGVIVKFEEA